MALMSYPAVIYAFGWYIVVKMRVPIVKEVFLLFRGSRCCRWILCPKIAAKARYVPCLEVLGAYKHRFRLVPRGSPSASFGVDLGIAWTTHFCGCLADELRGVDEL